jgi:hypothetical protein
MKGIAQRLGRGAQAARFDCAVVPPLGWMSPSDDGLAAYFRSLAFDSSATLILATASARPSHRASSSDECGARSWWRGSSQPVVVHWER